MDIVPQLCTNHGVDPVTERALRSTLVIPLLEASPTAETASPRCNVVKPRVLGLLQFINFDCNSYVHTDMPFLTLLAERLAPIVSAAVKYRDTDVDLRRDEETDALVDHIIEMKQSTISSTTKHTCRTLSHMIGAASTTIHWIAHDEDCSSAQPGMASPGAGVKRRGSQCKRYNPDSWVQLLPAFPMSDELVNAAVEMKKAHFVDQLIDVPHEDVAPSGEADVFQKGELLALPLVAEVGVGSLMMIITRKFNDQNLHGVPFVQAEIECAERVARHLTQSFKRIETEMRSNQVSQRADVLQTLIDKGCRMSAGEMVVAVKTSLSALFGAVVSRFFLQSATGYFEDSTTHETQKSIPLPSQGLIRHTVNQGELLQASPPNSHSAYVHSIDSQLFDPDHICANPEPRSLFTLVRHLVEGFTEDPRRWAMLCVPVHCSGHTVGVVVLHSKESFSEPEKGFIQRVMDMFGGIFQRDMTALASDVSKEGKSSLLNLSITPTKVQHKIPTTTKSKARALLERIVHKSWHLQVIQTQAEVANRCALVQRAFLSSYSIQMAEQAALKMQSLTRARRVRLQVPQRRRFVAQYGAKAASRVMDTMQMWHNEVDGTEELSEGLITKIVPVFDNAQKQWSAVTEVFGKIESALYVGNFDAELTALWDELKGIVNDSESGMQRAVVGLENVLSPIQQLQVLQVQVDLPDGISAHHLIAFGICGAEFSDSVLQAMLPWSPERLLGCYGAHDFNWCLLNVIALTGTRGTASGAQKSYMKKLLRDNNVSPEAATKIVRCYNSLSAKFGQDLEQLAAAIRKAGEEGNSKGNVAINAANCLKSTRNLRQQLKTHLWQQLELIEPEQLRMKIVYESWKAHPSVSSQSDLSVAILLRQTFGDRHGVAISKLLCKMHAPANSKVLVTAEHLCEKWLLLKSAITAQRAESDRGIAILIAELKSHVEAMAEDAEEQRVPEQMISELRAVWSCMRSSQQKVERLRHDLGHEMKDFLLEWFFDSVVVTNLAGGALSTIDSTALCGFSDAYLDSFCVSPWFWPLHIAASESMPGQLSQSLCQCLNAAGIHTEGLLSDVCVRTTDTLKRVCQIHESSNKEALETRRKAKEGGILAASRQQQQSFLRHQLEVDLAGKAWTGMADQLEKVDLDIWQTATPTAVLALYGLRRPEEDRARCANLTRARQMSTMGHSAPKE